MNQHRTPQSINQHRGHNTHRTPQSSTPQSSTHKPGMSTLDYLIVIVGLTLITAAIYYPLIVDAITQYVITH